MKYNIKKWTTLHYFAFLHKTPFSSSFSFRKHWAIAWTNKIFFIKDVSSLELQVTKRTFLFKVSLCISYSKKIRKMPILDWFWLIYTKKSLLTSYYCQWVEINQIKFSSFFLSETLECLTIQYSILTDNVF